MTKKEFKSWLRSHFPRGRSINRAAFLATANALGANIARHDLNNWIGGRPLPDSLAGVLFEQFLELVLRAKAEPVAAVYSVPLALDERENKILLKTAKRAHSTPEQFLAICLRIGFEAETGLDSE